MRKIQPKFFLTINIALVLMLSSCATHYVPNVLNTPLFNERGQTNVSIHSGISGFDPQFSVAITDNLALMVNGSFANREYEPDEGSSVFKYHKHNFVEGAIGYYVSGETIFRNEVFLGLGKGRVRAFDYTWEWDEIDTKFTRYFIQSNFGLSYEKLDGSGSLRLAMVTFDDQDISPTYYMEPVITGKAGSGWLKFVFQVGFSYQLNFERNPVTYNPFIFSLGLQVKPGYKKPEIKPTADRF